MEDEVVFDKQVGYWGIGVEVTTSIRPPRPFEAVTSNSTSEPLKRPSVLREASSDASHPPWPPRLSADMRFFRCQKIIEGSIFEGLH